VSNSEDSSASSIGTYASEVFNRKRLHGGFVEEVTELYDFRHRWMFPEIGGWLSRDPAREVVSNGYQFVINSPLDRRDPFGLTSISVGQDPGDPLAEDLPNISTCYKEGSTRCPALSTATSLCLKASKYHGTGRLAGFWGAYTKTICSANSPWAGSPSDVIVSCSCEGCDGLLGDTNPEVGTGQVYIKFFYYLTETETTKGKSVMRCCPCDPNIEGTVAHEFLHATCIQAQFAKYGPGADLSVCEHTPDQSSWWDRAAALVLTCLDNPGLPFCGLEEN
jgi:RHS repeat-associated protein